MIKINEFSVNKLFVSTENHEPYSFEKFIAFTAVYWRVYSFTCCALPSKRFVINDHERNGRNGPRDVFFLILIYYNHFVERRKIHRLTSWHHFVFCQRRIPFARRSASSEPNKYMPRNKWKAEVQMSQLHVAAKTIRLPFRCCPQKWKTSNCTALANSHVIHRH